MAPTSSFNTKLWVEVLIKDLGLSFNLAIYDHDLSKNYQMYTLDRFYEFNRFKELYIISLCSVYE